jgi:antibiotic biosynthesis monooxygenase (ABM) superfamily enzyme
MTKDAATPDSSDTSVTEVILDRVRPELEGAYADLSRRLVNAQAKFPGYVGGYSKPNGDGAWITLMRFATVADLDRWMQSPERSALLTEAKALVSESFAHKVNPSFPGWTIPNPQTGESPPNWKASMLVLLGLYPIVALEISLLMPLFVGVKPALAGFIGNAISVTLTAFGTMPVFVKTFDWWLFPKQKSDTVRGVAIIAFIYFIEIALFWNLLK